jgi:hypothetical protein
MIISDVIVGTLFKLDMYHLTQKSEIRKFKFSGQSDFRAETD